MSLLVTADQLSRRAATARGSLSALAEGLRRELQPLLATPVTVPTEKALLSREGGRCSVDGTLLAYDPHDARHRCPRCGLEYAGVLHDRYRLTWHQLWLAERTVHAALLGVLLDDAGCRATSMALLDAYATQYLHYPNADNVLGPSRPFFSTYLESIWLLQLCVALDLLEMGSASPEVAALGAHVRERLIEPSATLIASYDEGMSNRQVWNNAALAAAGRLLGRASLVERAESGPSGLEAHLAESLLADGSWYEGENYHLFAHRGLWYGVQLARSAGVSLPAALVSRYQEGFAAPFRTLLPDLTYPSRRDSQYAVSVRQPRFAEACELGVADADDERLIGMLARLYDPAIPRGETGRAASTADAERNLPGTGLTRADLSWRTLLHARPELPPLVPSPLRSDLLPAQGIGILRREEGALYAALDYGHSGGGHGHPDRLNLLLSHGAQRWFDDPGTGSYVDPSLHWYRSTLAHSAPLVDGKSQPRVHGSLAAFEDRGDAGWVSATAELVPGLLVRRTLVLMSDYLIDELEWQADVAHEIALPIHGADLVDRDGAPLRRVDHPIAGGEAREDGFSFLQRTMRIDTRDAAQLSLLSPPGSERLRGWTRADEGTSWWSALAPGSPAEAAHQPMLLARRTGDRGRFTTVWTWRSELAHVRLGDACIAVEYPRGVHHEHRRTANGWCIAITENGQQSVVELGCRVTLPMGSADLYSGGPGTERPALLSLPLVVPLGERHYRRSEPTWSEAESPSATVAVSRAEAGVILVEVTVPRSHRIFVGPDVENPLDNELASINGDGVQLYALAERSGGAWLLVPDAGGHSVHQIPIEGWGDGIAADATWRVVPGGYALTARVQFPPATREIGIDVIVNEAAPGRARRRGQLVLSGARGEFVYLRGDRHDPVRLLRFSLSDD